MDYRVMSLVTTGKYYSSGGAWSASTSTLVATMDTDFTANDVQKMVMFRIGSYVYAGVITSVIDTITAVVSGDNLPGGDASVDDVLVAPTVWSSDGISIANIPIMRSALLKLRLDSSITDTIDMVSLEEIRRFDSTSAQNRNKIVYNINGDLILMKKGSSLTTYGTMVVRYPRIPYAVNSDDDLLDIPDGAPFNILLTALKGTLSERYGGDTRKNFSDQLTSQVAQLLNTFGVTRSTEEIKEAVTALS
jgi:hypothetical protein